MFRTSSQKKNLFKNVEEIRIAREKVNKEFLVDHPQCAPYALTPEEERLLCRKFEREMLRFCSVFEPQLFRSVKCTALSYIRRFYMSYSVMEFYPQNVMLLCVYLACKVDEYNICIDKFVAMLEETLQDETGSFILGNELLLMEALKFSLTVHNSYRPLDGFISQLKHTIPDVTFDEAKIRGKAESFISDAMLTDATLLYTPSQIALAALNYSAENAGLSLSSFITHIVPGEEGRQRLSSRLAEIRQHLQLNYKFSITQSKLKELEEKVNRIGATLEQLSSQASQSSLEPSQDLQDLAPISKRRKTVDEDIMEAEEI